MSKFNQQKEKNTTLTVNKAGGEAYTQNEKLEFVSLLSTTILNNKGKFYESEDETTKRIISLSEKLDPLFVAKTALYTRNDLGIRSSTHILASLLAKRLSGKKEARKFYRNISLIPQDMLEILACYKQNNTSVPNAMKRGFLDALKNDFDAYQLCKYKGTSKEINLYDLINLCTGIKGKIKPKEGEFKDSKKFRWEHIEAFISGKIKTANTWEAKQSKAGSQKENKAKEWEEMIEEKTLPYLAMLRNLRNILQSGSTKIDELKNRLTDKKQIKNSLVFPTQFYTAFQEIRNLQNSSGVLESIENAAEISLDNVPQLNKLCIVVDVSGSMSGIPSKVASILSSSLYKANKNADFLIFDTKAEYKSFSRNQGLFTLSESMRFNGGGTSFSCIMNKLIDGYENVIILSDMQGWVDEDYFRKLWLNYKRNNPLVKLFSFDLSGYGTMKVKESDRDVYCISGFSEKAFDLFEKEQTSKQKLVDEIEKIDLMNYTKPKSKSLVKK